MSDSSASSTAGPDEGQVQKFRAKAREAASASMHHATLSEQYLQLSQKFDALAEQSATMDPASVLQSIAELEQQIIPKQQVPTAGMPAQHSAGTQQSQQMALLSAAASSVPTDLDSKAMDSNAIDSNSAANAVSESQAVPPALPSSHAVAPDGVTRKVDDAFAATDSSKGADLPKSDKRKPDVRRIVERNRKVKLANRRVRVKAKRADLKPRIRTAIQELREGRSGIASGLVTLCLVIFALSTITWDPEEEPILDAIVSGFSEEVVEEPEPLPVEPPEEEQGEQLEEPVEEPPEEEPEPEEPEPEAPVEEPKESLEEPPAEMELPETETGEMPTTEAAADESAAAANHRSEAGKAALLKKYGGSVAGEAAVSRGLDWLVSIQHPQGYWDFPLVGDASSPGSINNPIGGTAYALLPFLAAGQSHKEGKYSKQVAAGINYLTKIGVNSRGGYDLRGMINKQSDDKEPNEAYYVHGAATLALCEAYGMTKDRRLRKTAEAALLFIVNSQDPRGGGWRYNPGEPGSVSVTAIQVMALVAGKKAGLKVPESVFKGVHVFLDGLQVDREGRYGYQAATSGGTYTGARTAMALLCRMYAGWGRDDGDLRDGVALLDKAGPYDNLYSLYFATQVMKNWGGEEWQRWNERFQDDLIAQQETGGAAAGSWKPRTRALHAKQGGRLLTTSLAILTLQVYYRYQPLLPEQEEQPAK